MISLDSQIMELVKRIKMRMHIRSIMNYSLIFFSAALLSGIILSIVSRFLPIYKVYYKAAYVGAAGMMAGILYGICKSPGYKKAALRADSLGLHERTVTAVELVGDESEIALLQKKDTLQHLKNLNYKRQIPLSPERRYLYICLVLMLSLAASGFIPNPIKDKAVKLHEFNKKKIEQVKKIDKLIDEVKKDSKLTEEQKKELAGKLTEVKKEVKRAEDIRELDKILQRSEKKMELLESKYEQAKENLDKMAETLSKFDSTKKIAEMLKSKDKQALANEMKNLNDMLKNLNGEQVKQLSESLLKLAEDIKNNPALKDALKNAAGKLAESGILSQREIESLSDSISRLLEDNDFKSAVSQVQKQLGNVNQSSEGSQDQGQGSSPNGGSRAENSQGQGKGMGPGAGDGTDMGSEDQTPVDTSNSGLGSKVTSDKKMGEYEKIFTPKTLGGNGSESQLEGQKGDGGSSEIVDDDNPLSYRGESVPYNQVFGDYRDQAFENMKSSNIPEGMKEIVKNYFTSLDD